MVHSNDLRNFDELMKNWDKVEISRKEYRDAKKQAKEITGNYISVLIISSLTRPRIANFEIIEGGDEVFSDCRFLDAEAFPLLELEEDKTPDCLAGRGITLKWVD